MRTMWSLACAATLLAAAGCMGTGSGRIDDRFPHRIAFETRSAQRSDADTLEITELRGTRPQIERGGEYVLRGKYRLGSFEKGRVVFYETDGEGPGVYGVDVDLQQLRITKGEGTFELLHAMPVKGWFHVELEGEKGNGSIVICNIYFGSGDLLYPYDVATGQGS